MRPALRHDLVRRDLHGEVAQSRHPALPTQPGAEAYKALPSQLVEDAALRGRLVVDVDARASPNDQCCMTPQERTRNFAQQAPLAQMLDVTARSARRAVDRRSQNRQKPQ